MSLTRRFREVGLAMGLAAASGSVAEAAHPPEQKALSPERVQILNYEAQKDRAEKTLAKLEAILDTLFKRRKTGQFNLSETKQQITEIQEIVEDSHGWLDNDPKGTIRDGAIIFDLIQLPSELLPLDVLRREMLSNPAFDARIREEAATNQKRLTTAEAQYASFLDEKAEGEPSKKALRASLKTYAGDVSSGMLGDVTVEEASKAIDGVIISRLDNTVGYHRSAKNAFERVIVAPDRLQRYSQEFPAAFSEKPNPEEVKNFLDTLRREEADPAAVSRALSIEFIDIFNTLDGLVQGNYPNADEAAKRIARDIQSVQAMIDGCLAATDITIMEKDAFNFSFDTQQATWVLNAYMKLRPDTRAEKLELTQEANARGARLTGTHH